MEETPTNTKDAELTVETSVAETAADMAVPETSAEVDGLMKAIAFLDPDPVVQAPATESAAAEITQVAALTSKLEIAVRALKTARETIDNILRILDEQRKSDVPVLASAKQPPLAAKSVFGRVVEGVFDGRNMVGEDGQEYAVPPNYASKSKLVEGDMLKLTVTPSGAFIYKQVGPVERERIAAKLGFDETTGEYYGVADDRRWSVLRASVTYYKGEPGNDITLLAPKNARSVWAAVENVIKTGI